MGTADQSLCVLHLTMGAVLGGVTRYICDLSNGLARFGHRSMAAGAPGPWEDLLRQEHVSWTGLPLDGGLRGLWRAAAGVAQIVRDEHVDLIHCHFRRPLLACKFARLRGMGPVPIVYTLHLAPIPIGLSGKIVGFGDHVIAPAEEGRKWVVSTAGVDRSRVSLIPHGIDLNKWSPPAPDERLATRAKYTSDGPIVAFVGRFEYPKNEQWVLDLAVECRRLGVPATFLLCGNGPNLQQVRDRVSREGLANSVKLLGYTDPHEVYHVSDLVVLPSSIEGYGYVAAEAAACGVAVLRTQTAGWQETVHNGVTGRVVAIDHQEFLTEALRMLGDPLQLRQMGLAAAAFAKSNLSIDLQVQKTAALYHEMVAAC